MLAPSRHSTGGITTEVCSTVGLVTVDDSLRSVPTDGVLNRANGGLAAVVATVTVPDPEPAGAVAAAIAGAVAVVEAVAMLVLLGVPSGRCPDTTWP